MRLLLVSNGFPPRGKWGTEFYTHELVKGLAARGHEVAVMHPEREGVLPRGTVEEVPGDGAPVFLVHAPGDRSRGFETSYADPAAEGAFLDVLGRWRPELVHFTYLLWGLSVRMVELAAERGVPGVVTLTDYGLLCHRGQMYDFRLGRCAGPDPATCARCVRTPSRYDGPPAGVAAKRAAAAIAARAGGLGRVVVTRDLVRREAAVRRALDAARVLIAPTPVMAERFRAAGVPAAKIAELCYAFDEAPWRAARPAPEGAHRFAFLGQFTPQKGLATLLAAARIMERRLPESVEPWELSLYGGPAGGRHRRFAPALLGHGLGPRVRVHRPFEAEGAPAVLARIATVVVPSEWDENAPLTVLQARAAGVPVVASDVPGIACIVGPEHGRLVPPGDPLALADALRSELLSGRRRTGAAGLPLSLAEHLDRVEALHARALGRAAAGGGR